MIQIEQIPLGVGGIEKRAEEFLAANGLAPEPLDYFAVLTDGDKILACGGFEKNVIKCVATSPEARDMQLSNKIVSHLRSELKAAERATFLCLQNAPTGRFSKALPFTR